MKVAKKDEMLEKQMKKPTAEESGTSAEDERKMTEEDGEEEGDEEMEGEGEEEEKACKTSKSSCKKGSTCKSEDLTEDDLEKSLSKLTDYVRSEDKPTRKQYLLAKAQKEELNKSEQEELFEILGSGDKAPKFLSNEIEKAFTPSDDLQKALDVSDFLSETHEESKRVAQMLAETIEKSDNRQHNFNIVLAKAIAQIGGLTKAISERLEVIEDQPIHAPKSKNIRALEKGFAGNEASKSLSKSEILETMSQMVKESVDAGLNGMVGGVDMVNASSKYEMLNQINPNVLDMIQRKRAVH